MSRIFTLDDLRTLMIKAVGVDESVDLNRDDIIDEEFLEMGYDSLAILEVASRIGQGYGVTIPDSDVELLTTPRHVIDYVNNLLGADAPEPGTSTENTVVIAAPFDLVWDMTNDVTGWPELFSEYSKVEVVERDGNRVRIHLYTHPDETGRVWDWVSDRVTDRESRSVRAERVSLGPFEYMRIFWDYEPVAGDQVRMRWHQEFHLKAEAPVSDEFMAERINRNSAEQMTRIKGLVEDQARAARQHA